MTDLSPDAERQEALEQLEDWIELPMIILSLVWLVLFVVETLSGETDLIRLFGTAIWVIFLAEFALRLWLAPHKARFLGRNVISLLALAAPAFRILRLARVLRAARLVRGLRLVRVVGAANRGMRALKTSMAKRGMGYVLLLTLLVLIIGAAGMYALEPAAEGGRGFANFGEALWWTSMVLASLGSDYWPYSAEGRVLCFLITLFGLGVFGYVTASFASFFVERDAPEAPLSHASEDLAALRREVAALRDSVERLSAILHL